MIKEEFLQRIGLITTDVFTSSINKAALMEYTAEQIQEAYVEHVKHSPYPIKVSDIVSYWDRKNGNTTEALEQRAALIYEKYFKHPKTGYDHVCADKRIVYAFRVAFGTLAEYGSRTDFIEGIDKKDFVKAYVNARPEDYERAGNVIEGRNHNSNACDPTVVCIGTQAKSLAVKLYGEKVKFTGLPVQRPQLGFEIQKKMLPQLKREENKQKVQNILNSYLQQMAR